MSSERRPPEFPLSPLKLTLLWSLILLATSNALLAQDAASSKSPTAQSKKPDEVRHLFVAKLLWRRMAEVDLTPKQKKAFNKLSGNLRSLIDKKRAAVGITKETIKKRDEVYAKLKKTDLKGDDLWNTLQAKAGITAAQRDVFRETQDHYKKFKAKALALLTKEQRARLPKPKKKSASKPK